MRNNLLTGQMGLGSTFFQTVAGLDLPPESGLERPNANWGAIVLSLEALSLGTATSGNI